MRQNYDGLQFAEIKEQISSFCSFSVGHQIIENSEPQFSRLVVQLHLDRLKQALTMTIKYGSMPFAGVYDINNAVSLAMKDATLSCNDLLKIADQSYAIRDIKEYSRSAECEKDRIMELVNTLEAMETTSSHIVQAISRSGEVNDNASAELKRLRRQIKQLQGTIASRLAQYMARNSQYLQDDIIAKRNDRSVVLIKNNYKNTVQGLQYGQSSSGQATYVEPAELIPYNNDLQNAYEAEKREVQKILHGLSQEVKRDGNRYLGNVETLGLLDSIFAKARWAKEHDAIVGEINDSMDLIIEKGRHPLIDPRKVVANSYHIVKPIKTILITGPNTGGKTVSLKLVGLFTIMHLSGMALPCEYASIPVYDNVFYDIGDNQSIQDDLSTFSAHIQNLARICEEATDRSLVILDELGSGTDPVEGQALASAVLDYFRRRNIYTMATTHYAKLKAYGQQYDDIMLSSVEFDQVDLKPTYRYLENTIGQSNALEIATRYGMSRYIVDKAREFKLAQQTPEDRVMENLQKQLELVTQQSEALDTRLKEANELRNQLDEEKAQLAVDKKNIILEARQQAFDIIEEAREESEDIIEELKAQKNYDMNEVAKLKHKLSEIAEEAEVEEDEPVDDTPLKTGDYVKITLTNQSGEIISMDKKYATVLCGNTKIKASLGNLVKTARPVKKEQNVRAKVKRTTSFNVECNLIGMRVEEAMGVLDKFLDDALVANAPFVRVVHGMGTGALRTAVWNKLKKTKFVKKYEFADGNQGGSGATIVTLKDN